MIDRVVDFSIRNKLLVFVAVAAAALANKGGINLIATYEAFGTKMQGVVRQEIIFTNHCNE